MFDWTAEANPNMKMFELFVNSTEALRNFLIFYQSFVFFSKSVRKRLEIDINCESFFSS